MGKAAECQQPIIIGDYWKHGAYECTKSVHHYRTCGTGCSFVIAYCDEHGGDARAVEEMKAHVGEVHPEAVEKKV